VIEGWIVYLIALPLAGFVAWRARRHGHSAFQVAVRALFVIYLGWMVGAAFFPLPVRWDLVRLERTEAGVDVSLVPGSSTRDYLSSGSREQIAFELGGNVAVFVPFGFLLPLVVARAGTWRRVLACGLLLSLSVELGQLAGSLALGYSYRVTDVDDVILNVAGVLLGFALWRLVRARLPGVVATGPGLAGDPTPDTSVA